MKNALRLHEVSTIISRVVLTLFVVGVLFSLLVPIAVHAAVDDQPNNGGDVGRSCGSCDNNGSTQPSYTTLTFNLTSDHTQVFTGQPVTMSWTVANGQCYTSGGFGGWAQGAAGSFVPKYSQKGSQAFTVNAPGTYAFDYTCFGPILQCWIKRGGNDDGSTICGTQNAYRTKTVSVTVVPAMPTCTVYASPSTVTSGQSTRLTWVSTNTTGTATIANSSDGTVWTVDPKNATAFRNHAPTKNTTYTMTVQNSAGQQAVCVRSVTVTPPAPAPSANLKGLGCTIPAGGSNCRGTFEWRITNATIQPNLYNLTRGVIYSNVASSTAWTPFMIRHGANTVQARDGVTPLKQIIVNAVCATGSTWNTVTTKCESNTAPTPTPTPTPTPGNPSITVNPTIVPSGGTVTVSWDPNGQTGCVLSSNLSGDASTSGSQSVQVSNQTVFTISCGGGATTDSVTVSTIPSIYES